MAKDYAKKTTTKRRSPKRRKSNSKKGYLYLLLMIIGAVTLYRYSEFDVTQLKKDLDKTVKLAKHKAEKPPKFEFYTRLTKPTGSSTQITSTKEQKNQAPLQKVHQYIIQVASFKRLKDADELRAKLILQGYRAKLSRFVNNTVIWYRVEIGPFDSLQQARQQQVKLEDIKQHGLIKQTA